MIKRKYKFSSSIKRMILIAIALFITALLSGNTALLHTCLIILVVINVSIEILAAIHGIVK